MDWVQNIGEVRGAQNRGASWARFILLDRGGGTQWPHIWIEAPIAAGPGIVGGAWGGARNSQG